MHPGARCRSRALDSPDPRVDGLAERNYDRLALSSSRSSPAGIGPPAGARVGHPGCGEWAAGANSSRCRRMNFSVGGGTSCDGPSVGLEHSARCRGRSLRRSELSRAAADVFRRSERSRAAADVFRSGPMAPAERPGRTRLGSGRRFGPRSGWRNQRQRFPCAKRSQRRRWGCRSRTETFTETLRDASSPPRVGRDKFSSPERHECLTVQELGSKNAAGTARRPDRTAPRLGPWRLVHGTTRGRPKPARPPEERDG